MAGITLNLIFAATVLNGLLVGASLDQSIKQLPAWRRIGARAYAEYAKAADLGNGIAWYATIGIGALLVTIVAAVAAASRAELTTALVAADALSVLHTLATLQAAPTLFKLRKAGDDEAEQARILDRFERWQTVRVVLQVLTLGALILALAFNHGPVGIPS